MTPVAMHRRGTLLSVLFATLLLSTVASASGKSSQDQYEQRNQAQTESGEQKPVLHRVKLTSTGLHRFGLLPPGGASEKKTQAHDLQVGCGDGSVKVPPKVEADAEVQVVNKKRMKRDTEDTREKREFIHWFGASTSQYNPPIQSFQVHGIQSSVAPKWNPMQRPYQIIIPLWGNPRGVPVFFPPKPILFNPGYAMNNRPSVLEVPQKNQTEGGVSSESPLEEITIENRFRPNEDDGPVWGVVESEEDTGAGSRTTTTRRPAVRPTKPETPPLHHRPSLGDAGEGNFPQSLRQSEEDLQVIRTTTRRPETTTSPDKQLNRCVWAIISCCNPTNTQIKYNCFENLGCPGAFWDGSPCSKEVTKAALNAAQEFYDQS